VDDECGLDTRLLVNSVRSSEPSATLEDTQPVRRVPSWSSGASEARDASGSRHKETPSVGRQGHSCLKLVVVAVLLIGLVAGSLLAGGYGAWAWAGSSGSLNLVVLGLDRRPGQGYVVRADTIVLASVRPAVPQVALLSIPRDLYVEIPGYQMGRINTAHFWGESTSEGGGPALTIQTIEHNLGVHADRYVRLDFDGFRSLIDALGGIDVQVDKAIVDDAYPTDDYGTIRIEIPAGQQRMDGDTALRYARSRHGSSDFDRAQRQQEVMVALIRRLTQPEVWPRLPEVLAVAVDTLDTNLALTDVPIISVALLYTGPDGIERRVIDQDMTQPWTTPTGGAVLLPRWEQINPLVADLFGP
jgi:LCP family protein required for cell wall assembly